MLTRAVAALGVSALAVLGLSAVTVGTAAAKAGPTWTITTTHDTSTSQTNDLEAVACPSVWSCFAVGRAGNGAVSQALIERWNGTAWSIMPRVPDTSASEENELEAIACTSTSSCFAVGDASNGSVDQTLIERWNGHKWSIVTSPDTSASLDNTLTGVSCIGPDACFAVGSAATGTVGQTLILKWDGAHWTMVTSPDTSTTQSNSLYGVSCVARGTCVAVGVFNNGAVNQSLILDWNGHTWAIASSPDTSSSDVNYLTAVSCSSECVAVGEAEISGFYQTIILTSSNRVSWSLTEGPDTSSSQDNKLDSVSCHGRTCTAVGDFANGGTDQTLILRSTNFSTWSLTEGPDTSSSLSNDLYGVYCIGTGGFPCRAVGGASNGSVDQTLALVERSS